MKKLYALLLCLISTVAISQSKSTSKTIEVYPYGKVKPINLADAQITSGYLKEYIDKVSNVSILDLYAKMQSRGSFNNFNIVVNQTNEPHYLGTNEDEWVHKLIEAAGYYAKRNPVVRDTFQNLISTVLKSQDKDGYLNTWYQNPSLISRKGADIRFKSNNRHEFYHFGHLTQAGLAWKNTVGDDRLFQASIKFADLICDKFGDKPLPYKYNSTKGDRKYEHPNHELAMVELYRTTGNKRYLDFASHTLDDYGFWNFPEVSGHCVQENLLLAAGADVYLETGNAKRLDHLETMWNDIVLGKMYITGGVGNGVDSENYGKPFELPNQQNYCESCASIAKVFFDYRLVLATNKVKYADDMERTFYNALLAGYGYTGTEYFYSNHLEETGQPISSVGKDPMLYGKDVRPSKRQLYFNCSCCAPNIQRLIGSLQQYLFTRSDDGVQTQFYGNANLNVKLKSGQVVNLTEETNYPNDGEILFKINDDAKFNLSLRIPSWSNSAKTKITVNGKPVTQIKSGEYFSINRSWKKGDKVLLSLDVSTRIIEGRNNVASEKDKVAIMRGPLVYCLESVDNPESNIFSLRFNSNSVAKESPLNTFNNSVALKLNGWNSKTNKESPLVAIPYQFWANRGISTMAIWIPKK